MLKLLLIAFGGAAGALMRYGCSGLAYRLFGAGFPWGTLGVNLVGSFLIGFIYQLAEAVPISQNARVLILVGVLGAFTTFSTFSLECVNLIRDRQFHLAAINAVANCVGGVALALAGLMASRFILALIHHQAGVGK